MGRATDRRMARLWEEVVGAGDTALAMLSPMAGDVAGGWAGILSGDPGAVRPVQDAFAYQPRTEAGRRNMGVLGQQIQNISDFRPTGEKSVGELGTEVGDYWRDRSVPALQWALGDEAGAAVGAGLLSLQAIAGGPARYTRHMPDLKRTMAGYIESPRLLALDPKNLPADVTNVSKRRSLLRKPAVREREQYRLDGDTVREFDESPPERIVRPEDLEGSVLVPHGGDRTLAGGRLLQVGGVPLSRSVELQGGPGFSRVHEGTGRGWASNLGPARGLQANIDLAAEMTGRDPVGVYMAMGPEASNFSTHVADAALAQMDRLPISKSAKRAFDRRMDELVAPLRNVEQFVGLESPELRSQLMGVGGHSQAGSGKLRTIFSQEMAQARHRNEGFPIMEEIYDAVNDPRLSGAPVGSAGFNLFRGRPGEKITPEGGHASYTHDIAGDYIGRLSESVPADILFPLLWEQTGKAVNRRGHPLTIPQRINAIQTGHTYEIATPEWVDRISRYLEGLR